MDVEFQDLERALKPSTILSKGINSYDSESSARLSTGMQRGKMSLIGTEIRKDLVNAETPKMQKIQSEKVKIHPKLESLKEIESYKKENKNRRKAAENGINDIIHEEEEELDITADMDRNKNGRLDSSPQEEDDVPRRKDRIATFNPYGDDNDESSLSEEEQKDSKPTSVKMEPKPADPTHEENHIDDDPTNKEESDEEYFTKVEKIKAPKKVQKRVQQKYELQINESKKEPIHDPNRSSSSKYSVHDSDNFGEAEFMVSTKNNKIDNNQKTTRGKNGKGKAVSIQKIQRGTTNLKTNPTKYNEVFENHPTGSVMNASQQQARNMMNLGEGGKSPNTTNMSSKFPHFYPTNDMVGVSRNSNSNSPFRTIEEDPGRSPNFGLTQPIPQQMDPFSQDMMMQNQAPNPMFTQMMMLMQQNTQLMTEQAKFIRNYAEGPKSRSRSRSHPRRGYQEHQDHQDHQNHQESRSQIGMTTYSDIGGEGEEIYQPENIHDNSLIDERNIKSGSIQQVNYDTRTKKIRSIAKEKFLNKGAKPEEKHQVAERTVGIVLRNTKCQINPRLGLLEGEIVTVDKYIGDLELYQCRNRNHTGLYLKDDIKISKKKGEKIYTNKKSQKQINIKPDTSVEKRVEGIEREIRNNPRYFKNPESESDDREYEDEEYDKTPSYNSRISKDVDSIGDILPYNSLRQGHEFLQREESKRLSREDEFKIEKQPFTHLQREMIMNGDTFNESRKLDTITSGSGTKQLTARLNTENPDIFINSHRDSKESNFESATFKVEDRKIPKATLRRKHKKNKQNYLNKDQAVVEVRDTKMSHAIHSQKIPQVMDTLESSPLNESMSSNNSSTKSLKMKDRKNRKKKATQSNRYGVPMRGPENYSEMNHMRKLN